MKKSILILSAIVCSFFAVAQTSDEDAIRKVVTSAYIEGIQNNGAVEDIRKGIHPSFVMIRIIDNEVKPLPIEEWITAIEKRRREAKPEDKLVRTDGKFVSVDVTGTVAVVKLELSREGKKTFTDYIVLNKFNEGWRLVTKDFYRHQ